MAFNHLDITVNNILLRWAANWISILVSFCSAGLDIYRALRCRLCGSEYSGKSCDSVPNPIIGMWCNLRYITCSLPSKAENFDIRPLSLAFWDPWVKSLVCLKARGRAAIFLKNFFWSNGVFESKGICTCLWGISFYQLSSPKLDLVCFSKVKTSNENKYNITVYAKSKLNYKLVASLIYTLHSASEHEAGGELCRYLCRA